MSVTLNWSPFSDTSVDAYHIFRSITGFVIPFPNSLQPGAVLKFAATSPMVQTITFAATDFTSVLNAINAQGKGIVATSATVGPAAILVRCSATVKPVLKLYPCTALTQLGITAEAIGPRMDFVDIGTVPFVSVNQSYSFTDLDGASTDWYYLKTIKNLVYSLPSVALQPAFMPPAACVIEGRVIDLNGNPIQGVEVSAQIAVQGGNHHNTGILTTPVTTYSDSLGRWVMALPQRTLVQFVIPATGYNQVIAVPCVSSALFKHLRPLNDDSWDPTGSLAAQATLIEDGVADSIYGDF